MAYNCRSEDQRFGPSLSDCLIRFDFTLLFEQSILELVPSILLILLAPLRLVQLLRSPKKVPISHSLGIGKATVTTILFGLRVALLTLWCIQPVTSASIASATLSLLGSGAVLALSLLEHTRSERPSSLLCIYLLFDSLFNAAQLRSLYLRRHLSNLSIITSVALGTEIVLLLLEIVNKRAGLYDAFRNKYSPETTSGIINRSFFWWLSPLFLRGYRRNLSLQDLDRVDQKLSARPLHDRMQTTWAKYQSERRVSLGVALFHCFKLPLLRTVFPRLCLIGFTYAQPFLITRVISYVSDTSPARSKSDGYGLIAATGVVYLGIALSTAHYQHQVYRMITMFRGAMVAQIYAKSLSLTEAPDESAAVTLMSTDVDRVAFSLRQIAEVWARTVELAIGLWLLERQVGWICIGPTVALVGSFYASLQVAKRIGPAQKAWVGAVQRRVALTSSLLGGMKSIKMMGMSERMNRTIQGQRLRELHLGASFRVFGIWRNTISMIPVEIGPFLVFLIYTVQSQRLTTDKAFGTLAIISLLTDPARELLASYPTLISAMGCIDRIHAYLSRPNQTTVKATSLDDIGSAKSGILLQPLSSKSIDRPVISFYKTDIRPAPEHETVLSQINWQVLPGSINFIIGPVGSGKSTLLKAILGEACATVGSIEVNSRDIAFCCQSPWLQNLRLRDAIVGPGAEELDETWYATVLGACLLDVDVKRLPQGDDSLIGSRGVTLSGGQKQRVALARALYSRRSVLLLDDVLSALDTKTESRIVQNLFGPNGILRRNRFTVILVTHAIRQLHLADQIIALNRSGNVAYQGSGADFNREVSAPELLLQEVASADVGLQEEVLDAASTQNKASKPLPKAARGPTATDVSDLSRRTGDLAVYKYYADSFGWMLSMMILVMVALVAVTTYLPQIWLELYTTGAVRNTAAFCAVYAVIALTCLAAFYLSMRIVFIHLVPKSGANLHQILIDTVTRATQSYFNRADSGTILNLFSQDMTLVDAMLPASMIITLQALANGLVQIGLIATGSSFMALTIPGLICLVYLLQKVYLRTSRQIRFLDLEARSPLYTHFMETLEGLTTIRAFGWQHAFMARSNQLLDESQKPYYLLYCIQRWLDLVLQLLIGSLAVILVSLAVTLRASSSGGQIGLALNSILGFNATFEMLFTYWTTLETSLGAIARIRSTAQVTPQETDDRDQYPAPPATWPTHGEIIFDHASASWSSTASTNTIPIPSSSPRPRTKPHPPALQDLTFTIPAGTKLGICGRTGSGKSTLLATLLRLLDLSTGSILIDGHDIRSVSRTHLRNRIITIPQEPFFLPGSVRDNMTLTPPDNIHTHPTETTEYSDQRIRTALTKLDLWTTIHEKANGENPLDTPMQSLGLSPGQQQLFCLARAVLRKDTARVVVLDEATSAVDHEAEGKVQAVLRREFAEHTVVMVAHQVEILVELDMVAVLDCGRVVEMDAPGRLIGREESVFAELRRCGL
ncbi:putative multidrug resistance protein [Aspergillus saccharolyticus JOP 1030-1]|uniref:Putative multidrug resistance protein n=1 Tax=Aspergillus saccharolyticus JOP 1030-1 TaxID=1450539 RepID=A0A318ZKE2_9EURO|nr:putative multidrug resistance protein [Aspergillus saccharolyticus JOP 1030-1]PYH48029.1 putative multidrug resistance protein [Aspergillus saccharolyticus JOP 1030-1]